MSSWRGIQATLPAPVNCHGREAVDDTIQIPFLSLDDLIRSKLTHRDQDRVDVERRRRLR